uniref:Uncharacterized protein n=1 Tax=Oryza brachyantha TaxID=4533 RepID=J3M0T1_ORYBR
RFFHINRLQVTLQAHTNEHRLHGRAIFLRFATEQRNKNSHTELALHLLVAEIKRKGSRSVWLRQRTQSVELFDPCVLDWIFLHPHGRPWTNCLLMPSVLELLLRSIVSRPKLFTTPRPGSSGGSASSASVSPALPSPSASISVLSPRRSRSVPACTPRYRRACRLCKSRENHNAVRN